MCLHCLVSSKLEANRYHLCDVCITFINYNTCNKYFPWHMGLLLGPRFCWRVGNVFLGLAHYFFLRTGSLLFSDIFPWSKGSVNIKKGMSFFLKKKSLFCPKWAQWLFFGPKSSFLNFSLNQLIRYFWSCIWWLIGIGKLIKVKILDF